MGQAKIKATTNKAPAKKHDGRIKSIMEWISCIYMIYMTTYFVWVCPEGFVHYDLYKKNMFIYPTAVFIVVEFVLFLLSLDDENRIKIELNPKKPECWIDFISIALLISWTIGCICSQDKEAAFWGDVYRQVGFASMGLAVLAMLFISHIGGWKKINTYVAMLSLFVVFQWQILNAFLVDPLNFQKHGQYLHLMACLANQDQNAMFDGIFIAFAVGLAVISKNIVEKILGYVLTALGLVAGMLVASETFYFGLAVIILILLGFSLKHAEYFRMIAIVAVVMYIGLLLYKFGIDNYECSYLVRLSLISTLLVSDNVLLGLTILMVLIVIISLFYFRLNDRTHKIIHIGYTSLIIGLLLVGSFVSFKLYEIRDTLDNPLFSVFKSIHTRVEIDEWSVKLFEKSTVAEKIFGVGFGNYSRAMIEYMPNEMAERYGNQVLADSHSVFFDQLVSGGVVGLILLMALFICAIITMRKNAGNVPIAIIGNMVVAAFIVTGLVNFTLIVVTPLIFTSLGAVLSLVRDSVNYGSKCQQGIDLDM